MISKNREGGWGGARPLTIFLQNNYITFINTNNDLPLVLSKKTYKLLSTIHFTSDDIVKIIEHLDPNKAHGHDMISIRMIKICDASICKPMELIF